MFSVGKTGGGDDVWNWTGPFLDWMRLFCSARALMNWSWLSSSSEVGVALRARGASTLIPSRCKESSWDDIGNSIGSSVVVAIVEVSGLRLRSPFLSWRGFGFKTCTNMLAKLIRAYLLRRQLYHLCESLGKRVWRHLRPRLSWYLFKRFGWRSRWRSIFGRKEMNPVSSSCLYLQTVPLLKARYHWRS